MTRRVLSFIRFLTERLSRDSSSADVNLRLIGGGKPLVSIGDHTYINSARLYCWKDKASLSIGSYCSIAEEVCFILGGDHDLDWVSTYPFIERWKMSSLKEMATRKVRGNIDIASDVWIGHGVTILSGTKIGVGCVIGAGAVVRGDLPPYSIAAGSPAKVIRRRFDSETCHKLLQSRWWLMPKESIVELVSYMNDPESFLAQIAEVSLR